MSPFRWALTGAPVLILALSTPAAAGTLESAACRRDLTAASAGVTESKARLKTLAKARAEQKCDVYREQFLVVVRARAVFANCKTGADRESEVDRLDGTIEDINGVIAESCAVQ